MLSVTGFAFLFVTLDGETIMRRGEKIMRVFSKLLKLAILTFLYCLNIRISLISLNSVHP